MPYLALTLPTWMWGVVILAALAYGRVRPKRGADKATPEGPSRFMQALVYAGWGFIAGGLLGLTLSLF